MIGILVHIIMEVKIIETSEEAGVFSWKNNKKFVFFIKSIAINFPLLYTE